MDKHFGKKKFPFEWYIDIIHESQSVPCDRVMYGNKFLKEMLHEINSCTFSLLSDIYLLIFDHFIPLGFSIQKCIPKNFEFYRKASVLESIKFACNFIKRRLQHRCFTVKFVKFLRAPFLHNSCEWVLLSIPPENIRKPQQHNVS